MKNKLKFVFTVALIFAFYSCSDETETQREENSSGINLKGMQLDLKIDLSKTIIQKNTEIASFISEMAAYIYKEDVPDNERMNTFRLNSVNNKIYVNYSTKELKTIGAEEEYNNSLKKPCPTKKKVCYSKDCVEETIKEILGDGSRDVDIKYRRNKLSVTIEWTYLDFVHHNNKEAAFKAASLLF